MSFQAMLLWTVNTTTAKSFEHNRIIEGSREVYEW